MVSITLSDKEFQIELYLLLKNPLCTLNWYVGGKSLSDSKFQFLGPGEKCHRQFILRLSSDRVVSILIIYVIKAGKSNSGLRKMSATQLSGFYKIIKPL